MSDEPEVTGEEPGLIESSNDDPNAEIPSETDQVPKERDDPDGRRAQLRTDFASQLQKRIPKKPQIRRPQTVLTGVDAEKYTLRCRRTNDPNNDLTRHSYNMHRYRLKMIKPVVNSAPPLVSRSFFSQPGHFNQRLANFTRIERENALMVRRIAGILEGGATVDAKLKRRSQVESNSGRARQMTLLNIALANLALLKRLQDTKPEIETRRMIEEYKVNEKNMERLSMYPLYWKKLPTRGWEDHVERAKSRGPKAQVFLALGTDSKALGQIVIELNFAVTPMTAENFYCLCTGELGISYKCSLLHRIVLGILWQGGDVTGQEGYGNKSIYGETFPDENFSLKHDGPGTVSMANCGPDTNGSQFIITARSAPALDGTNVVFGKVVSGMDVLDGVKEFLSSTGVPKCDIFITNCGVASSDQNQEESNTSRQQSVTPDDDGDEVGTLPEISPDTTERDELGSVGSSSRKPGDNGEK